MRQGSIFFFNLVLVDVSSYICWCSTKIEIASPINRRWRTKSTYWPHPRLSKAFGNWNGVKYEIWVRAQALPVFPSPTGYMLWSVGCALLIQTIYFIDSCRRMSKFPLNSWLSTGYFSKGGCTCSKMSVSRRSLVSQCERILVSEGLGFKVGPFF